jgi:hypothetical protein
VPGWHRGEPAGGLDVHMFFLPSAGERDLAAPVLALEVHREVQLDRALEGTR